MHSTALLEVTATDGPFASVYLDTTHDTADADKQFTVTWRNMRDDLAGQGADEGLLGVLDEAVSGGRPPAGRGGRALLAAGTTVLVDESLAEPPAEPVARLSRLPYLVPLARHGNPGTPYVIAVVDQVGVTITIVGADGELRRHGSADGDRHAVHAARGGGAGHQDMQARTDEITRDNLRQAAEKIATATENAGAGLVVLGGEVQARSALLDLLPERTRALTRPVRAGSRDKDGGAELDRAVFEVVTGRRLARIDEVADRFRSGGAHGLAVQGLGPVTAALREANVETLLVGEPSADATVFSGDEVTQLGGEQEVAALGVVQPRRVRADEALPTAALAAGGELVTVDERLEFEDGFGAILRHT
ncbi:peptide chain release factor 2 [Amycolatopsis antarctica]|uniref:Peptide chain release factor 2 n=1 Tax=Amycolatopsis antarctica TaxID=1854586 RepID=A0A263D850_9PSEU|nr:hypothetical protein [Amycolatopsis antarctica]OZM74369.1 peptide chain release factor 2 [Amycolatopsis antarctica]